MPESKKYLKPDDKFQLMDFMINKNKEFKSYYYSKMKNKLVYPLIGILFLSLPSFTFHKFYMGVFQVNYVAEKKMIQITSRIFVDDLNNGMEKKYHKKTFIGTEKETPADIRII